MTAKSKNLADRALSLTPNERIALVDVLLGSLDRPDPKIDALWKEEVESRLKAYRAGRIKAIPLSQVVSKYRKKKAA